MTLAAMRRASSTRRGNDAASARLSPSAHRTASISCVAVSRLVDAGYQVVEAANGKDALDRLDENPDVALLFTDIVMPGGMTGDELANTVRALRPEVKILFTSGYAEPTIAGRELAHSGSWLKKPYTARELAERLRELLD